MPQKSFLGYFGGSFLFAFIALIAGGVLGYVYGGATGAAIGSALSGTFTVFVLSVMETSLSFDNAIVNAKVLENWDPKWRNVFLTWGMLVAVFGMRIIFPLLIVAVTTATGLWDVLLMATLRPAEYAAKMTAVHHEVSFFGGSFLLLVALNFFFSEKDHAWMSWIEKPLERAGEMKTLEAVVALLLIFGASRFLDPIHQSQAMVAGIMGIVAYVITHGLGTILGGDDVSTGDKIVRQGVMGFLYLEVLDASFSFDGVIGAFALTNNLWIIALGLGVGAFFVRSMTIYLVEKKTLAEFRFLEHGAFYAIIALSGIMFASGAGLHIPEWFTGLVGAAFIGAALFHSIRINKAEASA